MQEFENVPYDLEMVNSGSTFPKYGFDYKYFGRKGFNFANAPQPLKVDHAILERYQDHLLPGAVVLLALICPFSFSLYEYPDIKPALRNIVLSRVKKTIKTVIGYDKRNREGHPRSYGECPRMSFLPVGYPYIFGKRLV